MISPIIVHRVKDKSPLDSAPKNLVIERFFMNPPLSFRQSAHALKPKEIQLLAGYISLKPEPNKGIEWSLPFFAGDVRLVELTIESVMPATRHYILLEGEKATRVEYRTGYVEDIAVRQKLAITRENADEYIRFYMGLTRGQAGRVIPIENVDELPLREELTLITRRNLQALVTPLTVHDAHILSGCFLIGDKLFSARATIKPNGAVELEPLGLLADTLPVLNDALEA